jgi:hypothetical protein
LTSGFTGANHPSTQGIIPAVATEKKNLWFQMSRKRLVKGRTGAIMGLM